MTDGVLFFQTGALKDGVTVDNADYDMLSVDAGMKYKGFGLGGRQNFMHVTYQSLMRMARCL